jgi:hypothetical protein
MKTVTYVPGTFVTLVSGLNTSPVEGEEKEVQTGSIVYTINRAHGLQNKRQRQGGTCQCRGNKPAPWINELSLSPIG